MQNDIRPTKGNHLTLGPKGLLGSQAKDVKGPKMSSDTLDSLRQLASLANRIAEATQSNN